MEVSGRKDFGKKVLKAGNSTGVIFCQPCQGEDENVAAEGFCETCSMCLCSSCIKAHQKLPLLRNHVIRSKDEIPKTRAHTDPCLELCAHHKTEVVKFYCDGHNEVGCGDCMVMYHKTCKVDLIKDVSNKYGESNELHQINDCIKKLEQQIISTKLSLKHNLNEATNISLIAIEEIEKFRRDVNAYLDNAEAELLEEVEQLKKTDVSLNKKLKGECESMHKEIKEIQKSIDKNASKTNQLFISAKLAQKRLKLCQEAIDRIASESHINVYNFKPSKSLMFVKVKVNKPALGYIYRESKKKAEITYGANSMVGKKLEYVKSCNVLATDEKKKCRISGIALISKDEILLADNKNENHTLTILNVRKNTITPSYKLSSPPWDVTVINSEKVAVTLPKKKEIEFMNIKNELSLSHCFKVTGSCWGIDHLNGLLAVSFCSPPGVQILQINGDILHEVRDTSVLGLPYYIAFNHDYESIYVSDSLKDTLFTFTLDGKLKAKISLKKDSCPMNLAMTSDGTVIICCENISDSLSMIVPDTDTLLQLPIEHVQKPISILFCEDQNKIYIGESKHSTDSNNIKVFTCSNPDRSNTPKCCVAAHDY